LPNKKRRLNNEIFQVNKEIRKKISETKKKEKKELNEETSELTYENYTFDTSFWESEDDNNKSLQDSFTF